MYSLALCCNSILLTVKYVVLYPAMAYDTGAETNNRIRAQNIE